MKQFRNALNITVDSHSIVKAGYIQMPVPVMITEEWLHTSSISEEYSSNVASILCPLRDFRITEKDIEPFFGCIVCAVPDESIYNSYLEIVRQDVIMDQEFMTSDEIQDFLSRSDEYLERIINQYTAISDLLISRIWSYRLLNRNQANKRYLDAYKSLCTVSALQLLLMISVNTPKFSLDSCIKK